MTYNDTGRYKTYRFANSYLKNNNEILKSIFNNLMGNDKFLNFGFNKVIIVSCLVNEQEYSFHHNVLITNETIFDEYYAQVYKYIDANFDDDNKYGIDIIPVFKIRVWNMDNYANKDIKITKRALPNKNSKRLTSIRNYSTINNNNFITPIKNDYIVDKSKISTMDIETIEFKGIQIPILITVAYLNGFNIEANKFLLDKDLFLESEFLAIKKLWDDLFIFITNNNILFKNIFVHNLGSFDGYFIHKALSIYCDINDIKTIIDNKNKFISILFKRSNIKWLDSYRIFPVSLNELCKVFNVPGKTNNYKIEYYYIQYTL